MKKTNVMRILDANNIDYKAKEYDPDKGISGPDVARQLGEDPDRVFKTLVTEADGENYVFVVPVSKELDLKKAAKAVGAKKVDMIHQKDLRKLTGYVHGGCSPIAMKKELATLVDISAKDYDLIYVSAGKIGKQVGINPDDLIALISASYADIAGE